MNEEIAETNSSTETEVINETGSSNGTGASFKMNRNQLKYLLIIAMLIDHIAWGFVPTESLLGQIMHVIGRLTGPTMSVLLAEGYYYTRDRKKYAIRLGIFALISWIPFSLFESGTLFGMGPGMIYTLFIAFITVWMWDRLKAPKAVKVILVIIMCILSIFGDWPVFAVLWALFSFTYRERPVAKWISFCAVAAFVVLFITVIPALATGNLNNLFQLGIFLVPVILIFFYDGKAGRKSKVNKWFFYIFYPAHLLILYLIKVAVGIY
ncbi:MAG: conjugal transfer protein TraX [Lachnospiraceae bacterium]|nr:conjugal transfer protein TraX [Lachnospiraceae bacterium]